MNNRRGLILKLGYCLGMGLVVSTAGLWANPTGGQVAAGSAAINTAPGTVTVNQQSNTAIINWQSFSIASGELTKFVQPSASSAVLNRVLGGQTSLINGTLSANGQVYLINGNGVVVGPGGVINAGAFTASTRDIANADFLSGNLQFIGSGSASVQNFGTINALGGDVVLIGKTVDNQGTINAPNGTAGLVAGDNVFLAQKNADGSTITVIPTATATSASGKIGVKNSGTIAAATAELKAANGNIYALAIQNKGAIRATTVSHQGGRIFLVSDYGTVKNSGTLNASATVPGGKGGQVTIKTGGTAIHTGQIIAQGGQGGVGGNAEISGTKLIFNGSVDLTAPNGQTGNLSLDPATLDVIADGTGCVVDGENDSASTTISPTTVQNALASANLTLNADTNITVTDGITWTSANTLTLSTNTPGSTIDIYAPISGASGGLVINTAGSSDVISATAAVNVASFILESGAWQQNTASLPAFTASQDFDLQGSSSFLRVTGGDGTSAGTSYVVTDVYGLQGIATLPAGDFYALGADIDATGTSTWNSGAGFIPIGENSAFTGAFDGRNYTINGLYIDTTSADGGLFGVISAAVIANVGVTNANVTATTNAGALVGDSINSSIVDSCSSSGTINASGAGWAGGLVGYNESSSLVNNSQSSATVTAGFVAGGLVGENYYGSVQFGYSSGNVSGDSYSGGLVGGNYGTISNSYSSATVHGGTDGGLSATIEAGSITDCFSTGTVTDGTDGGLVGGSIYGTATDCYFDSQTSGITTSNGAGTPEPTSFFTNPANYPASWNFTTVWEFLPDSSFPTLRSNPVIISSPATPPSTPMTPASTLLDAFNAYVANEDQNPNVIVLNFFPPPGGVDGAGVDNPNSDGGAINNGSGSGHKHGNIASGSSSSSGASAPNKLLGPGNGINSIFNGSVGSIPPPVIVLEKFQAIFNTDSENQLHSAAFGP